MEKLSYLVIEYVPSTMSDRDMVMARMDGHYASREVAEGVARVWREEHQNGFTRIVVAEIVTEIKNPDHWS